MQLFSSALVLIYVFSPDDRSLYLVSIQNNGYKLLFIFFSFFSSDDVYLQSFHPSPPYIYLYNFLFFFMTKQLIWLPNYLLQNASKITVASIFSLSTGIPSAQFTPWQRYSRQTIKTWNIQTWRQILILEFRTSQECKFAQNKVSNLCVPYALLFRSGVYLSYK